MIIEPNPTQPITMSFETWIDTFKPIRNPLAPEGNHDGFAFEIIDEHMTILRQTSKDRVWTLVSGDDGESLFLIEGLHLVNREGYMITERPWTEGQGGYEILVYGPDEDDGEPAEGVASDKETM
ncbi:hypothetical protein ACEUZ9_001102 [Paracoccus litorisediminis]|uniref:hypothetical protein n=1 Tax=Paracoccus litorisediminis TaxID=2006130 RepID=UPI00373349D9